ncbi:hypothetical protein C0J52_03596 [Blattella germanica]|nr:hypothetical protein C0J52_03596 [Blattella germanica]
MKGTMTAEKGSSSGNNPLEQFVLLAKSAKGAAAVELIKQVLEAPGVHVFGELLDMPNIIEVYIIHGKLDQKNSQLEVDYAIGRDIQPADLGTIVSTLQEWCDSCEAVLSCVETQINRANAEKNRRVKHKEAIEQEIINIKKTLKTQSQDPDEAMATDSREAIAQGGDKGKKPIKAKGIRGSSKFWQKS